MTRDLLYINRMNIVMSEDVNEPSLRIRPRHRIRRNGKIGRTCDSNETFLRMLNAR